MWDEKVQLKYGSSISRTSYKAKSNTPGPVRRTVMGC
jgi:hypothetical protein